MPAECLKEGTLALQEGIRIDKAWRIYQKSGLSIFQNEPLHEHEPGTVLWVGETEESHIHVPRAEGFIRTAMGW